MKTILYNTDRDEITRDAQGHIQYFINGYGRWKSADVIELEVVTADMPRPDEATHKVDYTWVVDVANKKYNQVWTIIALTVEELARHDWIHVAYAKRLVVNRDITDPSHTAFAVASAFFAYFTLNERPIVQCGGNIHVYINEVTHSTELTALAQSGLASIEERPVILD